VFDDVEIQKKWQADVVPLLNTIADTLENLDLKEKEIASAAAKDVINASGIKMGVVMPLLRAALTGTTQGPDVFAIAEILGKERTVARIRNLALRDRN
jgi:glutamyl-tRNA synthetase